MKTKLMACLLSGLAIAGLLASAGCNGNDPHNSASPFTSPSPSELAEQGFAEPNMPRITVEELMVLYDNRDPIVLVDVRPQSGFLTGYIPGARNIPNEPREESVSALANLPKDRLIVTYCDCLDDGESAIAADRLRLSGYDNVKILWKGIYEWERAGGEIRR